MKEPKIHVSGIEMVPTAKLVPNPKNPNVHPAEQIERLAQIIEFAGWRRPITVSRRSGFVTVGHGRLDAAKLRGWKTVPVSYQDYDNEAAEYQDMVADNAIDDWAEMDKAKINADVVEFGPEFDIDLLGIKDFTLEPTEKFSPQADEDEVPDQVKPKTKVGDIYVIGRHRLMCGDSTSIDAVDKLMDGEKADFTITSPPYNVGLDYNAYDDAKDEYEYVDMLKSVIGNMRAIGTENYWCMWNVGVYPLSLHLSLLRDYFKIQRSIAWIKTGLTGPQMVYQMKKNPVVKNYLPNFGWEIIACCHVNKEIKGKRKIPSNVIDKCQTDVWEVSQHSNSKDQGKHPGAFPVEIATRGIELYADENVFEPFGGSGTTLIACEKTSRKCFMMEIDPHYCDVIIARWEKYTGKKAELQASGPGLSDAERELVE